MILFEPPFRFTLAHEDIGTEEIDGPVGWDDMQHVIARDAVYHGVTVKYTLDFNFIRTGRDFLQTVYHALGVEGVVLLTVYELNPNEHSYFASYQGRINLSAYVATEVDASTNAEETGFTRALLNLEDVEVDLTSLVSYTGNALQKFPVEGTEIMLHSKAVVKRFEGYVTDKAPAYNYRPVTREEETMGTLSLGFDDIKYNEFGLYNYGTGLNFSTWAGDEDELVEFKEEGTITVELNVDVRVQCFLYSGDFDEAKIHFYVGINGQRQRIFYWYSRAAWGGDNINGDLDYTMRVYFKADFNVKIGDKLYAYGKCELSDLSTPLIGSFEFEWQITPNPATYLKVSGSTTTPATTASGYFIHEVFARIVSSLTGRSDAFYSEILGRTDSAPVSYAQDGEMALLMLLNGSSIRGFPLLDRPPFADLKTAYSAAYALRPIGMGVEQLEDGGERVRIEGLEHFYQNVVVLELGMVADLKLSVAAEYYANTVEVGYEKWESGEDNSLDEVNTKQVRTTAITQLKGAYSALSKYVASGYLIESVRRIQFQDTPSKEDTNDKTNFWVALLRKVSGGFETERTQLVTYTANLLSPDTSYNLRWTPMRNAIRHGRRIRAGLFKNEKQPVRFTQGNANYIAETQFVGEAAPVVENGAITGNYLAQPLWYPEYYDFTAPLPSYQRRKIEENPYGIITFMDSFGEVKKGFIKEIKVKLTDGEADFRLLRVAD